MTTKIIYFRSNVSLKSELAKLEINPFFNTQDNKKNICESDIYALSEEIITIKSNQSKRWKRSEDLINR